MDKILEINNLVTSFSISRKFYPAVDGISLEIYKNEVLAIVGESGSGKSAMAMSIMQLLNPNYSKIEGSVIFNGKELIGMKEKALNKVRGSGISMIFQDALSALNPLMRIGEQIEESLLYHTTLNKEARTQRAVELLGKVGIVNPELVHNQYPHELSGGMRQRAMIAISIAANPEILIADEPTTALDVTIQSQILDLLRQLQKDIGSSIILITHDLGVVAEMATRVAVMYGGQIVEIAPVLEIFENPRHPYTRSLLASIPHINQSGKRLNAIRGMVPSLKYMPRSGCRFADRTPWLSKEIHEKEPTYHEVGVGHKVLCTCYKSFYFENEEKTKNGGVL
ncbi:MAG: ABC transporter ATP-binding protein [Defluviitaleaceae bacterium]|nr:ABC transporter ATP-binding protein [Defluviitaleaceae bacterium]